MTQKLYEDVEDTAYVEPTTKVEVERAIKGWDNEDYVLVMSGVRYKKLMFMNFLIYCVGFYADKKNFKKSIEADPVGFSRAQTKGLLHEWVANLKDVSMIVKIRWCRTVTFSQIVDNFGADFEPYVKNRKALKEEVKKLREVLPKSGCVDKSVLHIRCEYMEGTDITERLPVTSYEGVDTGTLIGCPNITRNFVKLYFLDDFIKGAAKTTNEFVKNFYATEIARAQQSPQLPATQSPLKTTEKKSSQTRQLRKSGSRKSEQDAVTGQAPRLPSAKIIRNGVVSAEEVIVSASTEEVIKRNTKGVPIERKSSSLESMKSNGKLQKLENRGFNAEEILRTPTGNAIL